MRGKTAVFIGSSGVGKSTVVNYLTGVDEIKTQEVRESDGKGRHTTTARHLYRSRFGGLIIDTPGMRELQLSDHGDGVSTQFSDIEVLLGQCRFRDCRHETEPNCAIKYAIESGELNARRWESYQKLEAEIRYGLRRRNKALESQERQGWKRLSVEARRNAKLRFR